MIKVQNLYITLMVGKLLLNELNLNFRLI